MTSEVEILISTMNRINCDFLIPMNISGDCVIINQASFYDEKIINQNGREIKFLTFIETGLSLSRNRAIENASGDICLFADDDLVYDNNYLETIKMGYEKYSDADIIIFNVLSNNENRPESKISNKSCRLGVIKSLKAASYRISFRRKSIIENGLKFDSLFGAGAIFNSGEENVFLIDCLRKKLRIYFVPEIIATVFHCNSTWYEGFNRQYFITRGALGRRMFKYLDFIYIIQFAIRKYSLYKNEITFLSALRFMFRGRRKYLLEIKNGSRE